MVTATLLALGLAACAGEARPAERRDAAPADAEPQAKAMPTSTVESRLLADLDRRLADPAAYGRMVGGEAGSFYEGELFPYVLPTLAMASLSRRPGADPEALRARKLVGGDGRYEALQGPLDAALLAALQARHGAPIDAYPGMRWGFDTVPRGEAAGDCV